MPLSCAHATTPIDIMFQHACVRVGSGGRVTATRVPVQVHANARSTGTTLRNQARTTLHGHARVPDQHHCEILPNFSSIIEVNK